MTECIRSLCIRLAFVKDDADYRHLRLQLLSRGIVSNHHLTFRRQKKEKEKHQTRLPCDFTLSSYFFFFSYLFLKSELLQLKFDNWKVKLQTVEKKF